MTSDNYKAVDQIKQALGSIARLGRAAAVHLALRCQRASGSTISSDLKNNIQLSVLLGGFDSGASTLMFEKDISNLRKPDIKGRCFVGSGNEIIETQSYYTAPEDDWEFDESLKATYTNPVYIEQKKRRNEEIDDSGFIQQHPLDEKPEEVEDILEESEENSEELFDEDDFFDDEDDMFDEDTIGFKFSSGDSVNVSVNEPTETSIIKDTPIIESVNESELKVPTTESIRPRIKFNSNILSVPNQEESKPKIKLKF